MASIIKVTVVNEGATLRGHARMMREANRRTMLKHREKRLGKHYKDIPETQPGGAYGYTKRGSRYINRKLIKKGHRRPLYYSGRMARFIRNNSRITATQHRSRFIARNYYPMTAQRRREVEAISKPEELEIAEEIKAYYLEEASKPQNKRKRRRRVK